MPVKTEKYIRKPLVVEAIQVTEDNFFEVAHWCNGDIRNEHELKYIHLHVHSPTTERHKRAYPSDWILQSPKGYKIYTDRAFKKTFDLEPTAEIKKAWATFLEKTRAVGSDIHRTMDPIDVAVDKGMDDQRKRHFRGSHAQAICNGCGAVKPTFALGERCQTCREGTVIPNPERLDPQ